MRRSVSAMGQSSLELIITLSFGLMILLPIVTLAFVQISNTDSTLSTSEAATAAEKLASVATQVATQGYPARQTVLLHVPQNVQAVYVGNMSYNGIGNEVIFVVNTNAGTSYIAAYTPINISGYLPGIQGPATYLLNVSATKVCPATHGVGLPCAFVKFAT